ncbi:MAG TPA: hypothetical protein VJP80_06685 [Candidatus Saccharimonadales bacterium]|nr:hypothetical protein [Candidatus Saccharimonadales bacterium]
MARGLEGNKIWQHLAAVPDGEAGAVLERLRGIGELIDHPPVEPESDTPQLFTDWDDVPRPYGPTTAHRDLVSTYFELSRTGFSDAAQEAVWTITQEFGRVACLPYDVQEANVDAVRAECEAAAVQAQMVQAAPFEFNV